MVAQHLDQSALLVIISVGMTLSSVPAGLIYQSVRCSPEQCLHVWPCMPVHLSIFWVWLRSCSRSVNGLLISRLNLGPFIVTLAVMSVTRGCLDSTKSIPIYGFPKTFTWWGSGHIGWSISHTNKLYCWLYWQLWSSTGQTRLLYPGAGNEKPCGAPA